MRALLLFLLATSAASAQTGSIEGTVLEADGGTAVIGANVRIDGTTLSAATDLNGQYRIIGVLPGMYVVTVSYVGYTSQVVQSVEIKLDSAEQANFVLVEACLGDYELPNEPPLITTTAYPARIAVGTGVDEVVRSHCFSYTIVGRYAGGW